jgi:hypothetical protein
MKHQVKIQDMSIHKTDRFPSVGDAAIRRPDHGFSESLEHSTKMVTYCLNKERGRLHDL